MFLFFFAKELKPIHKVKWQNFPPVWLFGTLQLLESAVISCCNSRNLSSAFRADTHTGRHRKHTQWHRGCITWGLGPSLYTPISQNSDVFASLHPFYIAYVYTKVFSEPDLDLLGTTLCLPKPQESRTPALRSHPWWCHSSFCFLLEHHFGTILSSCSRHGFH